MMAGAGFQTAFVISAAAVGFFHVRATYGKHRTTAVAAHKESRIYVFILLLTAIVVFGSAFEQCFDRRNFAVADNCLMVVLDDNMIALVTLDILAVDFFARLFA